MSSKDLREIRRIAALVGPAAAGGAAGVSSFNTRTGAVSLTSGDVTGALGFTPQTAGSYVLTADFTWVNLGGKPTTFAPSAHTHVIADVTGLQTAIDGKQPAGTYATGTGSASGANTGDQTTITGNAGSATSLLTARNINGVAFDGTAAITINAVDSTARLAASAVSAFGLTLIDDIDAPAARASIGAQVAGTYASGSGSASGTNTGDQFTNLTSSRFIGRVTAGFGTAEELTGTQATTLLDVATTALKGLVPASGGGTANFLRADLTWAAPPSGGGGAVRTVRRLTVAHSNATTTSTTITDAVNSWSHTVVAGKTYRFRVIGLHQAAALTTGIRLSVLPTTAVGTVVGIAWGGLGQGSLATGLEAGLFTVATSATVWPVGSTLLTTGVGVINSPHHNGMDFLYTCTTSGTLNIQFASEVAAAAAQMNIGSVLIVDELI